MTQEETRMIDEEERYHRQELVWGREGQARLKNSRVAVVGLGPQGAKASLSLAAMGIGNLVLVDGQNTKKKEMVLDMKLPKGARGSSYPKVLNRINEHINIEGYPTNLESRIDQLTLKGADVIVEATNSIRSKELAIAYGREKGIPVLSSSSRWGYTKTMFCNPEEDELRVLQEYKMPMFEGYAQDELMGLLSCGILAEEVRKAIFGESRNFLKGPVRYKLGKGERFGFPDKGEKIPGLNPNKYSKLKVACFGAGALASWGMQGAAKMGLGRFDFYDRDTFDPTNINRQVPAYDGMGKHKAPHFAEKMERMCGGKTASKGYLAELFPGFETETKYDLVLDFFDNLYARAISTAYAMEQGIPLISAGARPYSARWNLQLEGKTSCQDCLFDIYKKGRKEEIIRRVSCGANPNPSIVTSNAVAGVAAMLEVFSVYEPEKFGEPFNGEQVYRAEMKSRLGNTPLNDPCSCYSKPVPSLEISERDVEAFGRQQGQEQEAGEAGIRQAEARPGRGRQPIASQPEARGER